MQYRAEIDGLRAFAVLPVILFHAGITGFSGGFVGVDVFFVISGYLITRILAGDMAAGRYSLLAFYERRARRILPALVVVTAASTVAAWFILPPLEMQWYGQSVVATALFVANFYFLFRGRDYFAGITEEYPLLHTWSLAVEEQFYIVFPLLLWVIWRRGPGWTFWTIVVLSGLSLIAAEILSRVDQGINFYLLPSRAWELGAGAICALIHHRAPMRENQALAAAGFVLLVAATLLLHEGVRFPSLWAVPPVLGTALILLYAGPGTLVGRLLAWRPFVWVGLASYSAYLWHQPLFAFTRIRLDAEPPVWAMLGLSVLSVLLGWISLHLVEAPFRRRGGASAARVTVISGGVLAAVAGLGIALHVSLGAAGRTAAAHLPDAYYAAVAKPNSSMFDRSLQSCENFCRHVDPDSPLRRVVLVGDSHAQDLIAPLAAVARQRNWRLDLFITTGCSYTTLDARLSDCVAARARLEATDWTAYDEVLIVNRFSGVIERLPQPQQRAAIFEDYMLLARSIAMAGPHVTVFTPRPSINADPIRSALAADVDRIGIAQDAGARPEWQRALLLLAGSPRATVLDQRAVLLGLDCGAADCFDAHDAQGYAHDAQGYPIYRDGSHLSNMAARQVIAAWLRTRQLG